MTYRQRETALAGGIAGLLVATLLLAGCGSGLKTGGDTAAVTGFSKGVFSPNSAPYGKTYAEWGDEWWKWDLAIPKRDFPQFDETGEKCGVGQSGPVWFLVGTFGTVAERSCSVPRDKAILFPIVNFVAWIPTDGETEAAIRANAIYQVDHVTELETTLDGVALGGLRSFRFASPAPFLFTGPADEADTIAPAQTGTHIAFADGYWVMLQPLPAGQHTLRFRGKQVFPATFPEVQIFEVTVTYHLTVS